ncbi:MAG TPA: AAA family ATPase [Candidatus Nanoarchaeia archaeon]|nr:AAA family ATPase [Candidatus Nanoarchaeia archaeon]
MTKFITFVSGKGGVGKTTATLNVGHSLTQLGKKVTLVDANLATPNLAIHLGFINPEGTVNSFVRKEKNLREVTYVHESGLSLIPASTSYTEFQKTDPKRLVQIFEHLDNTSDFVLIDAPSGLGQEVSQVLKHSDEVILVVNPTFSSVLDALKTIQLAEIHENVVVGVLLNLTNGGKHELKASEVERILNYPILANVKVDKKIRKSVHQNLPLTQLFPRSKSARQFKLVAQHLCLEENLP